MRAWASALVLSVLCVACEQESQTPTPQDVHLAIVEHRDSVVVERPIDCKDPIAECTVIEVQFPVFTATHQYGSPQLPFTLNRAVRQFFVDVLGGSNMPAVRETDTAAAMPDIVDAARLLIGDYQEFKDKYPATGITWTVKGESKILAMDSMVCVQVFVDAFTGGAHGNTTTGFVIANSRTGKRVQIKDLVRDVTMFTDSAERAFRQQLHIGPADDLSDHNYFLESNRFSLPENMGITKDSLILYYNTYEIAPYAMGPTRITMPRRALALH